MLPCTRSQTCAHTRMSKHKHAHKHIYIYICAYARAYMCVCVCACVCMCVCQMNDWQSIRWLPWTIPYFSIWIIQVIWSCCCCCGGGGGGECVCRTSYTFNNKKNAVLLHHRFHEQHCSYIYIYIYIYIGILWSS